MPDAPPLGIDKKGWDTLIEAIVKRLAQDSDPGPFLGNFSSDAYKQYRKRQMAEAGQKMSEAEYQRQRQREAEAEQALKQQAVELARLRRQQELLAQQAAQQIVNTVAPAILYENPLLLVRLFRRAYDERPIIEARIRKDAVPGFLAANAPYYDQVITLSTDEDTSVARAATPEEMQERAAQASERSATRSIQFDEQPTTSYGPMTTGAPIATGGLGGTLSGGPYPGNIAQGNPFQEPTIYPTYSGSVDPDPNYTSDTLGSIIKNDIENDIKF